jgi:hypothetical protein
MLQALCICTAPAWVLLCTLWADSVVGLWCLPCSNRVVCACPFCHHAVCALRLQQCAARTLHLLSYWLACCCSGEIMTVAKAQAGHAWEYYLVNTRQAKQGEGQQTYLGNSNVGGAFVLGMGAGLAEGADETE